MVDSCRFLGSFSPLFWTWLIHVLCLLVGKESCGSLPVEPHQRSQWVGCQGDPSAQGGGRANSVPLSRRQLQIRSQRDISLTVTWGPAHPVSYVRITQTTLLGLWSELNDILCVKHLAHSKNLKRSPFTSSYGLLLPFYSYSTFYLKHSFLTIQIYKSLSPALMCNEGKYLFLVFASSIVLRNPKNTESGTEIKAIIFTFNMYLCNILADSRKNSIRKKNRWNNNK